MVKSWAKEGGGWVSVSHLEPLEPRLCLAVNGLTATYFNNVDFTGRTYQRIDAGVKFDWSGLLSPAPGIGGTTFSIRWTGLLKPQRSEIYTFNLRNNDGVRFWLDGNLLIDDWSRDT